MPTAESPQEEQPLTLDIQITTPTDVPMFERYPLEDPDAEPQFTVGQVAKMFFGMSTAWLRWVESHPRLIRRNGELVVSPRRSQSGARSYNLAEIELIAFALAESGNLDHVRLARTLGLIYAEASLWGLGNADEAVQARLVPVRDVEGHPMHQHAVSELRRMGLLRDEQAAEEERFTDAEEEKVFQDDAERTLEVIDAYLRGKMVSGATLNDGVAWLASRLLVLAPLTELTDEADTWIKTHDESWTGTPLWASTRDPNAFSTDAGKTYFLMSDVDVDMDTGKPTFSAVPTRRVYDGKKYERDAAEALERGREDAAKFAAEETQGVTT